MGWEWGWCEGGLQEASGWCVYGRCPPTHAHTQTLPLSSTHPRRQPGNLRQLWHTGAPLQRVPPRPPVRRVAVGGGASRVRVGGCAAWVRRRHSVWLGASGRKREGFVEGWGDGAVFFFGCLPPLSSSHNSPPFLSLSRRHHLVLHTRTREKTLTQKHNRSGRQRTRRAVFFQPLLHLPHLASNWTTRLVRFLYRMR